MVLSLDGLGDLVSEIGRPTFGPRYFELINSVLDIVQCTAFAFPDKETPSSVVLEGASEVQRAQARELGAIFVAGDFRNDPNLRFAGHADEVVILIQRASAIADDEFRERFYDDPELEHELIILGGVRDALIYASFYRSIGGKAFDDLDVSKVRMFAGFAIKALYRHLELTHSRPVGMTFTALGDRAIDRAALLNHLTEVLMAEGAGLSPREAEVCARIVVGYSAMAIGLNLGISENTVTTHRKRAYAKLGVCSQNELFVRYFTTVARLQQSTSSTG